MNKKKLPGDFLEVYVVGEKTVERPDLAQGLIQQLVRKERTNDMAKKTTKTTEPEAKNNGPLWSRKIEGTDVAVWQRSYGDNGEEKTFETCSISRSWKDAKGEWQKQSVSLTERQVEAVAEQLLNALAQMQELKAEPSQTAEPAPEL